MGTLKVIGASLALAVALSAAAAKAECDKAQAGASLLRIQATGAFVKREAMNGRIAYTWSEAYNQPNRLMTTMLISDAEACLSGQSLVVEFYAPNGVLYARSTPNGSHPIAMK